jgi:hypothetical protein
VAYSVKVMLVTGELIELMGEMLVAMGRRIMGNGRRWLGGYVKRENDRNTRSWKEPSEEKGPDVRSD